VGKKILVVDNNPVVVRILTHFLSGLGHEVQTAADGLAALHILNDFTPDVVITDLVMPNIGGDKLCRIIRDLPHLSHTLVVILSAIAAEAEADLESCGADVCIAKGTEGNVKQHLLEVLEQAEQRKSATLFDADLTLGLDQVHHREVTQELLASRRHLEKIVHHLTDGVCELGRDGRITYVNPTVVNLTGMREEKLLASDFGELFALHDRDRLRRELQRQETSPFTIDQDPPLAIHGHAVNLYCLPLEVEGENSLVVIIHDISSRLAGEQALAAAASRFAALFEQLPEGALLLDEIQGSLPRITACNQTGAALLNLPPEQVRGQSLDHLFPDAANDLAAALLQVRQNHRPQKFSPAGSKLIFRLGLLDGREAILFFRPA